MTHYYYIVRAREWVKGKCNPKFYKVTTDTVLVPDAYSEIMEVCRPKLDQTHHFLVKDR